MLAEIRDAIGRAVADPAVVGIVITGAGRGFCAGLDASVLAATTAVGSSGRPPVADDELPGLFSYFTEQPKPIIAAVNGVVAGGGFVLASMCDLRFASTAAAFTAVFTKRGLIAEHGTTWILPRLVGTGAALDLLWSSRRFDADEALRLGFVQQVVAPDDLLDVARRYVERPGRQRVAAGDRRHQAARVLPRRQRAAAGPARSRRRHVGRRRPPRRRRGRGVPARAPPADVRAHRGAGTDGLSSRARGPSGIWARWVSSSRRSAPGRCRETERAQMSGAGQRR